MRPGDLARLKPMIRWVHLYDRADLNRSAEAVGRELRPSEETTLMVVAIVQTEDRSIGHIPPPRSALVLMGDKRMGWLSENDLERLPT